MDRRKAIKYSLMPDGHIRGHDIRSNCGASEAHICPPRCVCDTIVTSHRDKLLITDNGMLNAISAATERMRN